MIKRSSLYVNEQTCICENMLMDECINALVCNFDI